MTVDAAATGTLSNSVTAASDTADPDPADNVATAQTTVASAALAITLTKHATLDRTLVAPSDRADAGDRIDYTFDVTNTGGVPLGGVTVGDPAAGMASCPRCPRHGRHGHDDLHALRTPSRRRTSIGHVREHGDGDRHPAGLGPT